MARQKQRGLKMPLPNVVPITRASGGGGAGGRPSGLGYDPSSGITHQHGRQGEEVDVFAFTTNKGYRADRFYTRSTNADGHGEKLQVRVPQGIDSQVAAAVRETAEYRSVQDFIRDAIVHRLEWLQHGYQISEAARRMLELERLEADNQADRNEMERMTSAVDEMTLGLEMAVAREDWGMVKQGLERGEELMEWIREPYKGQLGKLLDDWKVRVRAAVARWEAAKE